MLPLGHSGAKFKHITNSIKIKCPNTVLDKMEINMYRKAYLSIYGTLKAIKYKNI